MSNQFLFGVKKADEMGAIVELLRRFKRVTLYMDTGVTLIGERVISEKQFGILKKVDLIKFEDIDDKKRQATYLITDKGKDVEL